MTNDTIKTISSIPLIYEICDICKKNRKQRCIEIEINKPITVSNIETEINKPTNVCIMFIKIGIQLLKKPELSN